MDQQGTEADQYQDTQSWLDSQTNEAFVSSVGIEDASKVEGVVDSADVSKKNGTVQADPPPSNSDRR
jgi:hypothetical protein